MFLRSLTILKHECPDRDAYPFSIPAIKALDTLAFRSSVGAQNLQRFFSAG